MNRHHSTSRTIFFVGQPWNSLPEARVERTDRSATVSIAAAHSGDDAAFENEVTFYTQADACRIHRLAEFFEQIAAELHTLHGVLAAEEVQQQRDDILARVADGRDPGGLWP